MKRILPLVLLLAMLCGCKNTEQTPTIAATEPIESTPDAETVLASGGTYLPNSEIEKATNGALRQYTASEQLLWIAPFGNDVLLACAGDNTRLIVLSGMKGIEVASEQLPIKLDDNAVWQVTTDGFAYYIEAERTVVYLDKDLQKINTLQLPETITALPVIDPTGAEVYYCVEQTVYGIETARKITRPLRTNACVQQSIEGCYYEGAVLACLTQGENEKWTRVYISTENGETVHDDRGVQNLQMSGNKYLATLADGDEIRYIYGTVNGKRKSLSIPGQLQACLAYGGAVSTVAEEGKTTLSFYALGIGKRIAEVSVSGTLQCKALAEKTDTGDVWLLTEDNTLLCWELSASAIADEAVYAEDYFTADVPDQEGLQACKAQADKIGEAHGVQIRIWEHALVGNDAYAVTAEFDTAVITEMLAALEKELSKYPNGFLGESAAKKICICLVRDMDGKAASAYYWSDGTPYIIISTGVDVGQAFEEAFCYILDIHVLGNSPLLDDWTAMNPEGFVYGGTVDSAYLGGATQAFINSNGTVSVTEDRASIFYHAIRADSKAMFASETMQAKLLLMCKAIRDAWNLEKSQDAYLWEQHLNTAMK